MSDGSVVESGVSRDESDVSVDELDVSVDESDASGDGSGDESADEDASDVDSSGNVEGLINDADEEDTINNKELGRTEEALEELKSQLLEHAAQVRDIVPRTRRLGHGAPSGASAKRPRSSSPASSLSDEGTDTGEPGNRQRKRQRMSDESRDEAA